MKYDFDVAISRTDTNSAKWDYLESIFGTEDVLPLWVADMDFASPPCVVEALVARAKHPVYGYPGTPQALFEAASQWMAHRFNIQVQPEWMTAVSGVISGLHAAVEAFTRPGDKIIVQPPVYPPFFNVALSRGRYVIENPLREQDGYYVMDFEDLRSKIDDRTKLLILCSPHNPVGRVWTKEELAHVAAICVEHDIIILTDEIHADLVYEKNTHTPFASLGPEASKRCITFLSPSKTFNVAGLFTSIAFTEHTGLLKRLKASVRKAGTDHVNLFGIEACIAAYKGGEEWLEEVLVYLKGNATYIERFLQERLPQIQMRIPEATYLGWLDFREFGFSAGELKRFIVEEARLGFNDGASFGTGGEGFQRINFGCSRAVLEEAMLRLEKAVYERRM
ncbi:MalY/PatB family protein [Aneurinibacillus aneurinilyticus]|uniref:cysteine-S-conjugate beta-lyase n=1 Tax=Aneurinibacillus aneurinilyticus TaxID=1391 RepID=A0A848CXF2_ANEAE|nr:PatB family C-S lyase [Aneurinibacillus aneurinilyticus]NMF00136.1 putative C-S lyase [Aneurinibacillus aneurinilyticus]